MSNRILVLAGAQDGVSLNMLYLYARCEGWSVQISTEVAEFIDVVATSASGDRIHVHDAEVPGNDVSNELADLLAAAFSAARSRGARVLWSRYFSSRRDSGRGDWVTLKKAGLIDLTIDHPVVDESNENADLSRPGYAVLPRASYFGLYPPPYDRREARAYLGLDGCDFVLTALDDAVDAAQLMEWVNGATFNGGTVTLLVTPQIVAASDDALRLQSCVEFVAFDARLDSDDVAYAYSAADAVLATGTAISSLREVLLSATFGRPCLMPTGSPSVGEVAGLSWVRAFDPSEPGASGEGFSAGVSWAARNDCEGDEARVFASHRQTSRLAIGFLSLLESDGAW